MQFGTAIRCRRRSLKISQEELAERAGLHRTYISDVERGARNISLESIHRLAAALETSLSKLFDGIGFIGTNGGPEGMVEIVLVEDNPDDVEMTRRALQESQISNPLVVLRDGAEALEYLLPCGPHTERKTMRPQVILLDLGLPKVNGLEVLRRLKAEPKTQSIPVIVLTASKDDADIATSKRLGAKGYLMKPVGLQNLSTVTTHMSLQWALLKVSSGSIQVSA